MTILDRLQKARLEVNDLGGAPAEPQPATNPSWSG